MSFRFQFRRGTTAERDASNPILAAGEPAVVLDSGQPAELVLGDGVTAMADLRAAVWDDDTRLALAGTATQPGDLHAAIAAGGGLPPQRIGRKVLVSNFQTGHGWTTSGAGHVSLIRDAAWAALSAVLAGGIWVVLIARRVCRG